MSFTTNNEICEVETVTLLHGKYKGIPINDIIDKKYLLWAVKTLDYLQKPEYKYIKDALWTRIKQLPKL